MAEPLLSFFVSAATALGKLTNWFAARDKDQREQIATYFDQIAACLREVAERIEAGEAPRDTCRRLAVFADEIEGLLKDRGYVTAAGDASIDETRMRLAGELKKAGILWDPGLYEGVDPAELAADDLGRDISQAANRRAFSELTHRGTEPSEATVDRVQTELAERASAETRNVQPIWDAAGEFVALAATIRAR